MKDNQNVEQTSKKMFKTSLVQDMRKFKEINSILESNLAWVEPQYNLIGFGRFDEMSLEYADVLITESALRRIFDIVGQVMAISGGRSIIAKEALYSLAYAVNFCDVKFNEDGVSCENVQKTNQKFIFSLKIDKENNSFSIHKEFINSDMLVEIRDLFARRKNGNVHVLNKYVRNNKSSRLIAPEGKLPYFIYEEKSFGVDYAGGVPTHEITSYEKKNMVKVGDNIKVYGNGEFLQYPSSNYKMITDTYRVNDSTSVRITNLKNILPAIGDYKIKVEDYKSYSVGRNGVMNDTVTHGGSHSITKEEFDTIINDSHVELD